MNKSTLYITFDGLSDPLGQSQIIPYICGLARNGFPITVLSCEKEKVLLSEEVHIRNLFHNLPVEWLYILYDPKGGIVSRWLYTRKLLSLAETVRAKKNIRLLHCRSYLSALLGLRFKLKYRIPFIFDMRGFWADERIDGAIWSKSHPLQHILFRYFKKKEKQFLTHAGAIVSLTTSAVDVMSRLYPNSLIESKTTVIPCCTNTSLFDPAKTNLSTSVSFDPQDHVLIYTGSIGTWYYTKEMIDCILAWKQKIPRIKLMIVTKDIKEIGQLLSAYAAEERQCVSYISASYSQIPGFLKWAKAAIFFIKPAYSKVASSPTKMAECWAMDLPIISNSGIGDNDRFFNGQHGGVLLNEFTQQEYLLACERYLKLPHGEGGYRKIALDYFDSRMAVEKYSMIYRSLL